MQPGNAGASAIAAPLLAWYDVHARALPWRTGPAERRAGQRPDPYRVWLSEVMLQQTTVAAVKAYFETFTRLWPNVAALAAAEDDAVMSAWAGLGYYARARNLLACARAVSERHGGRFPETAALLRDLPGIGDYTSAAIASIAFDEPAPVVDGNIERVTTRLFSIEQPLPAARALIRAHVAAFMSRERPGDFAQAMMDLGATICTPKKPACILCPIAEPCSARAAGTMERFPVKLAKRAKPLRRGAAFVAVRPADGAVWLRRRPASGMLGGMAEPPSSAWSSKADGATGPGAAPFPADWTLKGSVAHGFTHFDLELEVWRAASESDPPGEGWWSGRNAIGGEALPTLMRKAIAIAIQGENGPTRTES
ncbi:MULTISPECIES: A/G-specific adenine glycosylase [unclassified Aureimonas]|uniref:A/G-specific adenine glycosylase n=1 Tax=unclassified Aureimonas TaxID=2615206 RepID=UPI0006FDF82C|nr:MULTISPECIES: A/G-specific adenine glycosylase [unclassified Aureimonas]KQT61288.1 A/G-specific adenine glycosylase [Aureimonas sp. Leaf460]KQT68737.1 A/G-specific adenine glycosylase [Aureimonas sp. Leaf427]